MYRELAGLSDSQIQSFIHDGFVKIEEAFPRELATEGRSILWRDTGCDENNPSTWTKPVIRLGTYAQEVFVQAANTPLLHKAFDQLTGLGHWLPAPIWGRFRFDFPRPTIQETQAGISTRAFRRTKVMPPIS